MFHLADFWKAAFVEKREDISWAMHSYLHTIIPTHRNLDLAAYFANYWHLHYFRDRETSRRRTHSGHSPASPNKHLDGTEKSLELDDNADSMENIQSKLS